MTTETDLRGKELFERIRVGLREQRQAQQVLLDDLAGSVFDLYRAMLGDEFTVDKALRTSLYGHELKTEQWNALSDDARSRLDALQAKYPVSVDKNALGEQLADGVAQYLTAKQQPLSTDQAALFPAMMTYVLKTLGAAGVQFGNTNRQAFVSGLVQLTDYQRWLVSGGQRFMDLGDYSTELRLTDNAITAQQTVLLEMLRIAKDVKVNYGCKEERVTGISEVKIERGWGLEGRFVVEYKTKDGKKGKIDILHASITVPEAEERQQRIQRLLLSGDFSDSYSSPRGTALADLGLLYLVAGKEKTTDSLDTEMKANELRYVLTRAGIDFHKPADAVIGSGTDCINMYWIAQRQGKPTGAVVGVQSGEYGRTGEAVFVCSKEQFEADVLQAQEQETRRLSGNDEAWRPQSVFDPLSLSDYLTLRNQGDGLSAYSVERRGKRS